MNAVWQDVRYGVRMLAKSPGFTEIDRARQVRAVTVSSDFFALFDLQPTLGRIFLPEEERPGGDRVVILSHTFWRAARVDPMVALRYE